jgi:uncharacterized protein YqeY
MSELKNRIRTDMTRALKARDELRTSTLRMVVAAITAAEVAGEQARELSDDEVQAVIVSQAKKSREAAKAFAEGGRHELAEKETAEAAILAEYLPEQLSAEQVAEIVAEVVALTGAADDGMKAMSRVMGAVQPRLKGRADGRMVAAEVKRQLGV